MTPVATSWRGVFMAGLLLMSAAAFAEDPAQLMRDGIALHDQGQYDAAAEKFEQILALFPENALASYELAFSHAAAGRFERCVEVADAGLANAERFGTEGELVAALYMILASCHSDLGDAERALEVFDAGLGVHPGSYDLHFNKAVSLGRRGDHPGAIDHLQQALEIAPGRSSPYFMLGANYQEQGADVLAILSYLSFLQREFNTARCISASRSIFDITFARVQAGEDGTINVMVDANADDTFQGLTALDMSLATAAAAHSTNDGVREPIAESMTETLRIFITMTSELDFEGDPESIIGKYLLPATQRLVSDDMARPFAWYTAFVAGVPGTDDWPQTPEADAVSDYLNRLSAR